MWPWWCGCPLYGDEYGVVGGWRGLRVGVGGGAWYFDFRDTILSLLFILFSFHMVCDDEGGCFSDLVPAWVGLD